MISCWLRCEPRSRPVHWVRLGWPHLEVNVVSNYISCRCGEWHTLDSHYLYICAAVYTCRAGSRWPTPLPGFSISHAALNGYEWVDGNDRALPVMPGWSPSARRVNWVIRSEASSWQCPWKCHRSPHSCILLLFFLFFSSVSSSPCRVFSVLNLSTWCLFPYLCFPLLLSCLSFPYSFSFHPSLWDNIHRTCQR